MILLVFSVIGCAAVHAPEGDPQGGARAAQPANTAEGVARGPQAGPEYLYPEREYQQMLEAVNVATAAKAQEYAREEYRALRGNVGVVDEEFNKQKIKPVENYGRARTLITQAKNAADSLAVLAGERMEIAKRNAIVEIAHARASVDAARALHASARDLPTKADSAALAADLVCLENALKEISGMMIEERFFPVYDKARAIWCKADDMRMYLESVTGRSTETK